MYQALLVNHSLIVLAHKFHIFGNFLMHFNFPLSTQCWNLGLILEFLNLCMCHILVSPNATHASSLILLAWQLLLMSYFSCALWWCNDPWFMVPRRNLGSPVDYSHEEILLGARWYRDLRSWSTIASQLMWFIHLGTFIWNSCSIIPLKLLNPLSLTLSFDLVYNFKSTLVVLWTTWRLMCLTHFLFHYPTQHFSHFVISGRDFFKGERL